jgi:hypothetical protein
MNMRRHRRIPPSLLYATLLLALCLYLGCGQDPKYETLRGLQEENQVLQERIGDPQGSKAVAGEEADARLQSLRTQYEDQLTTKERLHREKVAQLQREASDLRLRLATVLREKLTLEAMLDQQPRLKKAKTVRSRVQSLVLWMMLGLVLLILGYVSHRYRAARDRLHLLTMQQVSELRHGEGEHDRPV